MIVDNIVEYDDGSAMVQLNNITKEELQMLVQEGMIALLKRLVEEEKVKSKIPALLKE